MRRTIEMEIEVALLQFCNTLATTTLDMVEKNDNIPLSERKAFATGVMCAMDGIDKGLKPTLLALVKENPKHFENLN